MHWKPNKSDQHFYCYYLTIAFASRETDRTTNHQQQQQRNKNKGKTVPPTTNKTEPNEWINEEIYRKKRATTPNTPSNCSVSIFMFFRCYCCVVVCVGCTFFRLFQCVAHTSIHSKQSNQSSWSSILHESIGIKRWCLRSSYKFSPVLDRRDSIAIEWECMVSIRACDDDDDEMFTTVFDFFLICMPINLLNVYPCHGLFWSANCHLLNKSWTRDAIVLVRHKLCDRAGCWTDIIDCPIVPSIDANFFFYKKYNGNKVYRICFWLNLNDSFFGNFQCSFFLYLCVPLYNWDIFSKKN